jgi:hypothetical protein
LQDSGFAELLKGFAVRQLSFDVLLDQISLQADGIGLQVGSDVKI